MCSPCFEYTLSGLVPKSDMLNYRKSFGLVCLYKEETRDHSGGEEENASSSSDSNLSISISSSSSVKSSQPQMPAGYQDGYRVPYLYVIGGKSYIQRYKAIEKYDVERNEWTKVRMQLNFERVNPSTITFGSRYIYVIGGTLDTDCLEVIDTFKENINRKAELFLLIKGSFSPWFNDMLLPLDEEGLLLFCGERTDTQIDPVRQLKTQKTSNNDDHTFY